MQLNDREDLDYYDEKSTKEEKKGTRKSPRKKQTSTSTGEIASRRSPRKSYAGMDSGAYDKAYKPEPEQKSEDKPKKSFFWYG